MQIAFSRIIASSALVGALAVASTAPSHAAQGRNAAFAAGVAAGALGGAALSGGYGYPAYGGYYGYGGPRYAYGSHPYRHYHWHWYR
jgi:hypothetical protein